METLGDAYPRELTRVREVLAMYKEIGPGGLFGAAMIEATLRRADKAVIEGDTVAMIAIYQELKKIE